MKEIIILGRGNGWSEAPDGECWAPCSAMSCRINSQKELTRGFDIHGDSFEKADAFRKLAEDNNVDYYTQSKFPLEEIIDYFKTDYFANTICYMIALAIYEGVEKIDFYGVNMNGPNEIYSIERACVEFWVGLAIGKGLEINIYGERSSLLVVDRTNAAEPGIMYGYNNKQRLDRHVLLKQEG